MKRKGDENGNGVEKKPAAKKKSVTKKVKAAESAFAYGIDALAKKLDVSTQTARVMCRNSGVKRPKGSKSYGWDNAKDLAAAVAKCRPAA